ncbi:MAG: hypothetical protein ACYC2H_10415 [Thermoplasmatota archaeon]
MTDGVQLVETALPEEVSRRHIVGLLGRVPHADNRLWLAKWVVHQYQTPAITGPRLARTIYRQLHGPARFLEGLEATSLEMATLEDFQGVWIRAIHEPTRTFPQCRKGPLDARTRSDYQRECFRFLSWALGKEEAMRRAHFLRERIDDPDPIARILPWDKVEEIRGILSGLNLVYFTLLTACGPSPTEIRKLPVDAMTYDGAMCLIRCPPTKSFPDGRVVALHHGDEVLAAYQAMIRRDNPQQKLLFPRKKDPDQPLTPMDMWVRVNKWGQRIGIPDLEAEDLRLTYICYLLSRRDVGEHYVMHAMGVKKPDRVLILSRAVEAAVQAGHDFGQPQAPRQTSTPGHRPCTACGKLDNPVGTQHKVCSGCGTPFGDKAPTKATYILADLADAVRRLQEITGETSSDRADQALAHLERSRRRSP